MLGGGIFSDYLTLPWEEARGYIKEELEQLRAAIQAQFNKTLNTDGTVSEGAFSGAGGDVPSYLANTGPKRKPKWDKVDLANGVKNRLAFGSLPQASPSDQSVIGHDNGANFKEVFLDTEDLEITNPSNLLTLTETGVVAGTYGDTTNLPQITVDEKGRVTQAGTIPFVATAEPSDGDKGDITVTGSGLVWEIDPDAVTNTELADMPAATLKGSIAGGDPADLDADDVSGILDGAADPFLRTSAAPSGSLTDGDKGDITVSSSTTVWTIDNDVVTPAKMDNGSALSIFARTANSSGDRSDLSISDGQTAKRVGTSVVSARFGPASITVINPGTTTYTVPAGVYSIMIELVGPGGGGGSGDQGATTAGVGAGGGAGGYAWKLRSVSPGDSFTVAVGSKGTGGAAGQNNGNPGTANTVFDSGGTPITGNLGSGGAAMATGTTLASVLGGAGGTATGGDINISGQTGARGVRWSTTQFWPGVGGDSKLGLGGHWNSSGTGANGTGYGSGGAGAGAFAASSDSAGGDGTDGVIIVYEFN